MSTQPFDLASIFEQAKASRVTTSPSTEEAVAGPVVSGEVASESNVVALRSEKPVPHVGTAPETSRLWDLVDYKHLGLTMAHAEKVADSAIAPLVAAARPYSQAMSLTELAEAYKTMDLPSKGSNQGQRIKRVVSTGGVMWIPHFAVDSVHLAERNEVEVRPTVIQMRAAKPENNPKTGKPLKYEFAVGGRTPIGMHPAVPTSWIDDAPEVALAEGVLKGDSGLTAFLLDQGVTKQELDWAGGTVEEARANLRDIIASIDTSLAVLFLTVGGVDNWKKNPEWRSLRLEGRSVLWAVDGDVADNPNVWRASAEAWEYMTDKHGANVVLLAPTVKTVDGEEKVGMDDYLAKHGSWATLQTMRADSLPAKPQNAFIGGPGTNKVIADTAEKRMMRHVIREVDDGMGHTTLQATVTPVLDAVIEIVSSESISEGYDGGKARLVLKHDLRVGVHGKPVDAIVKAWPDTALDDIQGILGQAGVAGAQAEWFEIKTTVLRLELEGAIRKTLAEDYAPGFAQKRTGNVALPAGHEPDLAERAESDLLDPSILKNETVWVWAADTGAIGPDTHEDPKARSEIGEGAGAWATIPAWQPPTKVVKDLRVFLTDLMGAYNDRTLRYASQAKTAWAVNGGRKGGSLYYWALKGSGKTVDSKCTRAFCMGLGDAPSAVGNTSNYVPNIPDNRSTTTTVIGDFKRMPGDQQKWPSVANQGATVLRRDYDGNGRGRNGGAENDFETSGTNRAWPSVIVDGEVSPWFDSSTEEKILTIGLSKDYIKTGQAKAVIDRLTDEGLPNRLGRSLISWTMGRIPGMLGDAPQTLHSLEQHWRRQATSFPEGRPGAWALLSDKQIEAAKKWTPRTQEVVSSYFIGHAIWVEWMRAVVRAADDSSLDALIDNYETEGATLIWEAMRKHVDRTMGSNDVQDPTESVLAHIGLAVANGKAYVVGYAPPKGVNTDERFAALIGKETQDKKHWDLIPSEIAKVTGDTESDVKAALRNIAEAQSDGLVVKPRINGIRVPGCYRVKIHHIIGNDDAPDKAVLVARVEAEIARLQAELADLLAQD